MGLPPLVPRPAPSHTSHHPHATMHFPPNRPPNHTPRPATLYAQTQKFGHVTFFWNGNRSGYFDSSKETYLEVPSDNVGRVSGGGEGGRVGEGGEGG